MDKQSLTPITESTEMQRKIEKQIISDYGSQFNTILSDTVKTEFASIVNTFISKLECQMIQSIEILHSRISNEFYILVENKYRKAEFFLKKSNFITTNSLLSWKIYKSFKKNQNETKS